MTRTPKQTAQAIEDAVTEIDSYKKKITDEMVAFICEKNGVKETTIRNNIKPTHINEDEKGTN